MTDEKDNDKGFQVEDRRTSTGGAEEKPPEETAAGEIADEAAPEESGADAKADSIQDEQARDGTDSGHVPRVDFSTFIFSLFSSALIQLGEMEDPVNGKTEQNLDAAQQTIDILNVMKEKTEGNLTEEESKLLENASAELKWKFLNAVKEKG
jgi:PBP1b-binding outer membrane lipoprotein LpoB